MRRFALQMGQAGIILRRIHALCGEHGIAPLAIFCGDFNSTPQSGICDFIKQGELDCYMANRQTLSGQLESREKGWPPGGGSGRRTSDGGRVIIPPCHSRRTSPAPQALFSIPLVHSILQKK